VKNYSLVYSKAAADVLLAVNKRRLKPLLIDLQLLADNPFICPDYLTPDRNGRQIENLLVGEFVLSYWVDHSANEIRIVEITDVS
jgi:hypothetical protein